MGPCHWTAFTPARRLGSQFYLPFLDFLCFDILSSFIPTSANRRFLQPIIESTHFLPNRETYSCEESGHFCWHVSVLDTKDMLSPPRDGPSLSNPSSLGLIHSIHPAIQSPNCQSKRERRA